MSETPRSQPPVPRRAGWLTVLMVLIGVVLLLPGICAGAFMAAYATDPHPGRLDPMFVQLWLVCFAIAASGIALIWWALKRPRQ